jgi:nucleoside-diphosphate-sugar epimerase
LNSPVCGVTGSGGYVGSRLVRRLRADGAGVVEFRGAPPAGQTALRKFQLEGAADSALFRDIDVLIHCAYDFKARTWSEIRSVNVDGSRRLFESAARAGVKRFVLISSISAFAGCRSLYGRAKLEIEAMAADRGAVVVRPGLVFGPRPGGMLRALDRLSTFPLAVPIVGAGNAIQYVAHEDDLGGLISLATRRPDEMTMAPVVAAHRHAYTLRAIMTSLSLSHGRRPRFVPIPAGLVAAGLSLLEAVGLRPKIRRDSLVSLLHSDPAPDFGPLERLGLNFRPFGPPDTRSVSSGGR